MADPVVTVAVLVSGGSPDRQGLDTPVFITSTPTLVSRLNGPYSSLADMVTAGYLTSTQPYKWAQALHGQDVAPASWLVGEQLAADAADWTVTAQAVVDARTESQTFYGWNAETRTIADMLDIATFIESADDPFVYIAQTSDSDLLDGVASNDGELFKNQNYNRSAMIYHATDGEYLDGAWLGRGLGANLDQEQITWSNQQLRSVPFDSLNGTQVDNIIAENANYYGRQVGLNFTRQGTMASGRSFDITTTNDWLSARLKEEITAALVNTPTKISFDQAGVDAVGALIEQVLRKGVTAKHFADQARSEVTNEITPRVVSPIVANLTSAEKQTRTVSYTGEVVYAAAIETVGITINANF